MIVPTSPSSRRLPPIAALLAAIVLVIVLAACGTSDDTASSDSPVDRSEISAEPLRVGASPVPHAAILRFVRDTLAPQAGLNLDIKEYTDYVLPNTDLERGELDANYFQTPAYLEQQIKARGKPLVAVVGVHIEPLGVYAAKAKSIAEVPQNATIALPKGEVTVTRSLKLLAAGDLIELRDDDAATVTPADVEANPKGLRFDEVDAARTPRALDDHDLAVINGNYALEAGLTPADDALMLERATRDNPNVNLLVTTQDKRDDPRIEKLGELLTSPQVRQFIERRYGGAVVPGF